MKTYAAFLRGVNMTGHNSIKMTDLTSMFIKMGYADAITYIQSGNVIFRGTGNSSDREIELKFEKEITSRFKYDIKVMIRSVNEMKNFFSVNPYLDEENFYPAKIAVLFLNEKPSNDQIMKVKDVDYPPDKFKIVGSEIYVYCPNGFGRTKLYTNFFEKKMGISGTARNWKTITTILNLAEKQVD